MKRQERHHLKENEFAKFVARTGESFRQHGRSITGTGVLVVVALLMVAGFFLWRANRQEKASTMLAEALATLEAPVAPPAIGTPAIAGTFPNEQARLDAALPQLMAAAEAFPSTDAGIEARYQAAAVLAELGTTRPNSAIRKSSTATATASTARRRASAWPAPRRCQTITIARSRFSWR